jgi:hypothetical protein
MTSQGAGMTMEDKSEDGFQLSLERQVKALE